MHYRITRIGNENLQVNFQYFALANAVFKSLQIESGNMYRFDTIDVHTVTGAQDPVEVCGAGCHPDILELLTLRVIESAELTRYEQFMCWVGGFVDFGHWLWQASLDRLRGSREN